MKKILHNCFCHSALSSLARTVVFTCGHYLIDTCCTHFIGGAEWHRAFASSIVGPILNAIWYFILDRVFFSFIFVKITHRQHQETANQEK